MLSPRLADDLGAVQGVDVVGSVHNFVGADAVGVVHELQEGRPAVSAHLLELPAVPVLPLPAERNALRATVAISVPRNCLVFVSKFATKNFQQENECFPRTLCWMNCWWKLTGIYIIPYFSWREEVHPKIGCFQTDCITQPYHF